MATIYCKIDGIEGPVTAEGFEGCIEPLSFNVGFGRGISTPTGNSSTREASTPSCSEITISKTVDSASTDLFKESLRGLGKTYTFTFLVSVGTEREKLLEIVTSDTMISGYSLSGGGSEMESISLNYTKIEYTFFKRDASDSATPQRAAFDLITGVAS